MSVDRHFAFVVLDTYICVLVINISVQYEKFLMELNSIPPITNLNKKLIRTIIFADNISYKNFGVKVYLNW